jgi:uncharacterized protein YlxW (UPF0749 family)
MIGDMMLTELSDARAKAQEGARQLVQLRCDRQREVDNLLSQVRRLTSELSDARAKAQESARQLEQSRAEQRREIDRLLCQIRTLEMALRCRK